MDTPRNRVIETITSSAKHRPPLLPPDPSLYQPLIFAKHERRFGIVINLVTAGFLFYGVLFMDFGSHEHCFSPIRRRFFGKITSFLSVQPEDQAYLAMRVEAIKATIDVVDAEKKRQANRQNKAL